MTDLLTSIQAALGLPHTPIPFTSSGALPSAFAVTDLACASIAAAGQAASELLHQQTGRLPDLEVDRRLASFWFATSIRPLGWSVPPLWDPIAGDYATHDGWIRLHTNAPHHRAAPKACSVPVPTAQRWRQVAQWAKAIWRQAVVDAGGCAAEMRTWEQWQPSSRPGGERRTVDSVRQRPRPNRNRGQVQWLDPWPASRCWT